MVIVVLQFMAYKLTYGELMKPPSFSVVGLNKIELNNKMHLFHILRSEIDSMLLMLQVFMSILWKLKTEGQHH